MVIDENTENFFEKNLAALSRNCSALVSRLSRLDPCGNFYEFSQSRSGETVPAIGGKPLHSMFDPVKEAKRFMETSANRGLVVLLGIGGVYHPAAALDPDDCYCLLVIEFNISAFAELLRRFDYSHVFCDPRFHILVDPSASELENYFVNLYKPALHGAFCTVPLRTRIAADTEKFSEAAAAIENAVKKISGDYSVQSYFALRWFSNILRNLNNAALQPPHLPVIAKAAVCAAGPSLDLQIPLIKKRRKEFFLIATDTGFPALKSRGITPDAVISIDCQHISYCHFMEAIPDDVFLFLDIASPPLVASRSKAPCFFYGGHPLCLYLSRVLNLPFVDTSGGNVTYAAVSLAGFLGARSIELFGADFSYPLGICYAKGTYIHDLFLKQNTRLKPLESLYSSFLFRTPFEKKVNAETRSWYYETQKMNFYREYLETENPAGEAELVPAAGIGALVSPMRKGKKTSVGVLSGSSSGFGNGPRSFDAKKILASYRREIEALPMPEKKDGYPENLGEEDRLLLNTLLPAAAAIRRKAGAKNLSPRQILEETKKYCYEQYF